MKDGGPAFPRHYGTASNADRVEQLWHSGMSLRDYFAAAALQGFLARGFDHFAANDDFDRKMASWVYETADAMLAEREKQK